MSSRRRRFTLQWLAAVLALIAILPASRAEEVLREDFSGPYPGSWVSRHLTGGDSVGWAWSGGIAHQYSTPAGDRYFYPDNLDVALERRNIDFSAFTDLELSFKHIVDVEPSFDKFEVQARDQHGTWRTLWTRSRQNDDLTWATRKISLADYAGQRGVTLRFRFVSDGTVSGAPYDGVYLDDIVITGTREQSIHNYAIYGQLFEFAGGADADGDGYYETFSFEVGIDADAQPGPASVWPVIICETTGQSWWAAAPITIAGTETDYQTYPFTHVDFANLIEGNTALDFTVEIWDAAQQTLLAWDSSIGGEPIRADSITASTYSVYGELLNFAGTADADGDGYYETFSFELSVDADASPGSATVWPLLISETTGQSWWASAPISVSGNGGGDAVTYAFSQQDFTGRIEGNTDLDFSVEIWDEDQQVVLARDTSVSGEPLRADSYTAPTYSVYGDLFTFTGGNDADSDGYYETFSFFVGIDADAVPGPASVLTRIICETTAQDWWASEPITVTGDAEDYRYFEFTEQSFAGHMNGNTDLDFTVEIWDPDKQTLLASDISIGGEPIPADTYTPPTYSLNARILDFQGGTDADSDSYYESFVFGIAVDANISSGQGVVLPLLICETTGQSWWASAPFAIDGGEEDFHTYEFNEADFAGHVSGSTDLDFTVEIWDETRENLLARQPNLTNEPVRADSYTAPQFSVYGDVYSLVNGEDADNDGYYETFTFSVGVDADVSGGSAAVWSKVICETTGQTWWANAPHTVTGTSNDPRDFGFDQTDFAGRLNGSESLYFAVEVWDQSREHLLARDENIDGEPVRADGHADTGGGNGGYLSWIADLLFDLLFEDRTLTGDPDGDGVANLAEYAFDMDPADPGEEGLPTARIDIDETQGEVLVYEFQTRRDNPNLRYHLEMSSDWQNWEPSAYPAIHVGQTATRNSYRVLAPTKGKRSLYFRVRVEMEE